MLITKRNEYALQAMVLLTQNRAGRPATARSLAAALKTSPAFMSKIVQRLTAAGLLASRRGRGGGLTLARSPKNISVKEIFRAADGQLLLASCLARGPCRHLRCPLFPLLEKIQAELDRNLNHARLSDLAKRELP